MASSAGSSIQQASDIIYDFPCTPCDESDLNSEAVVFCKQCMKQYCDSCAKSHERLFRGHSVLSVDHVGDWGTVTVGGSGISCSEHGNKALEMFCADHGDLCCTLCVSLKHRGCKDVKLISDVAKGIYERSDFKQVPSKVEKVKSKLKEAKKSRDKASSMLKASRVDVLSSIKAFRKKCNDILDELEKRTIEELDRLFASMDADIQKDIDSCKHFEDELTRLVDMTYGQGKSKREHRAFIGYTQIYERCDEAEGLADYIGYADDNGLTFQRDTEIERFLEDLTMLGNFDAAGEDGSSGHGSSLFAFNDMSTPCEPGPKLTKKKTFELKSIRGYDMDTYEDRVGCGLSDICQLADGTVVVLDSFNFSVKVLDSKYKVMTEHAASFGPAGMCTVGANEFAVSMNYIPAKRHQIEFMMFRDGELKLCGDKTVSLDHVCNDIACDMSVASSNRALYVASSTALYVYSLSGKLKRKLYEDTSKISTVGTFAVDHSGARIYLTNMAKRCIITLDLKGNQLSEFSDRKLRLPSAIGLAGGGHLFVANDNFQGIMHINMNSRRITVSTVANYENDGIRFPCAFLFKKASNELLVPQTDSNSDLLVLQLA